jgi:hypothetical protein
LTGDKICDGGLNVEGINQAPNSSPQRVENSARS